MDNPTDPPPPVQTAHKPEPQICCDCGFVTHQPVKVGEAYATGGAGRDVFACPRHAPHYVAGGAP